MLLTPLRLDFPSPLKLERLRGMYVLSRSAVVVVNALDVTMDVSLELSLLSPEKIRTLKHFCNLFCNGWQLWKRQQKRQ